MLWIRFLTWFKGDYVGQDSSGNKYYRAKGLESIKERRWVIYQGIPEASKIPAEWHGWLHHTVECPPAIQPITRYSWEKNHLPNLTGTPYAYRPPGYEERKNKSTGDYEAWTPHKNKE